MLRSDKETLVNSMRENLEKRDPFPRARGRVQFEITDCVFCNLCAKKCPTEAIVCDRKDKSWAIDHLKCILCGNCVDSCRRGCLSQHSTPAPPMLQNEIESFQKETQTPAELEAEMAAKGKKPAVNGESPAANGGCCASEDEKEEKS